MTEIERLVSEIHAMIHEETAGILATVDRIEVTLIRSNERAAQIVAAAREREAARKRQ